MAAAKLVEDKQAEDKASILSSDTVKEFLTQYYTKEKLGENNTRIQPYMTESAYSQELTSQNDAMNQVYKDYILDYHFVVFWLMQISHLLPFDLMLGKIECSFLIVLHEVHFVFLLLVDQIEII